MQWIAHHRQHVIIALAFTAPLAVAAVLVPFRDSLTNAATALILVAVIVAIASTGSRSGGYLSSLSSTLWFDFFFTHPYYSFDIHGRVPQEITICLLVVGLGVTELAARAATTSGSPRRSPSMSPWCANSRTPPKRCRDLSSLSAPNRC